MGRTAEDDRVESVDEAREAPLDHARPYADLGMRPEAEALARGERFPASRRGMPLILDTDIGGDPDDAIAVAVAARRVPELSLVVTADERDGQRARFARFFLDVLGRADVAVVAGRQLGDTRYVSVEGLTPADVPRQPSDVPAAVGTVLNGAGGVGRWVGMGPMSNLADLVVTRPDLAERLDVTQMGGALRYRDPSRAEHNVRLDVEAARTVLASVRRLRMVISDVTFNPPMAVSADGGLYRRLAAAPDGTWGAVLRRHLDAWFARFYPSTMQHDPLTLAAALGLPFVDFSLDRVALDAIGRMSISPDGVEVFLSHDPDYPAFLRWLVASLGAGAAAGTERA